MCQCLRLNRISISIRKVIQRLKLILIRLKEWPTLPVATSIQQPLATQVPEAALEKIMFKKEM